MQPFGLRGFAESALLDFYIGTYCSQRPDHLQPPLQDILRLGAYQILYLEKVPDSAAVNSSVELAKYMKRGQAAGLVNAVLRKLSQNKDRLPTIPDQDEAKYLSIRYSHPKWLVKRLLPILGRTETEVFLACGNAQPPITAQINTCRTTAERTAEALAAEGVSGGAPLDAGMPAALRNRRPGARGGFSKRKLLYSGPGCKAFCYGLRNQAGRTDAGCMRRAGR